MRLSWAVAGFLRFVPFLSSRPAASRRVRRRWRIYAEIFSTAGLKSIAATGLGQQLRHRLADHSADNPSHAAPGAGDDPDEFSWQSHCRQPASGADDHATVRRRHRLAPTALALRFTESFSAKNRTRRPGPSHRL